MFIAGDAPFVYRAMQRFIWLVAALLTKLDLQGCQNVPRTGPAHYRSGHDLSPELRKPAQFGKHRVPAPLGDRYQVRGAFA